MKNTLLLLFLFSIGFSLRAQTYQVDTLWKSGPINDRINLVMLSDGYRSSELNTFINDATAMMNSLFAASPFTEYKNYFNVFAIKVPSTQSGATHAGTASDESPWAPVPVQSVNTVFGSRFDVANIHRLLVPNKASVIGSVLANNFPNYDEYVVLVNSPYYGGSGGAYSVTSTAPGANEIVVHEVGHSFANLGDEYESPGLPGRETPNTTAQTTRSQVKWNYWIDASTPVPTPDNMPNAGIGLYEGASYHSTGWYRPKFNCKMRSSGVPFCEVCKETFIETIHGLVSPINDYSPASSITNTNASVLFDIDVVAPIPNTLKVSWVLDGNPIPNNSSNQLNLDFTNISTGQHTLTATVIDTTEMVRKTSHSAHSQSVQWDIDNQHVVSINSIEFDASLTVFPNPFTDIIQVEYELDIDSEISIKIYDLNGKLVFEEFNKVNPGTHTQNINTSTLGLSKGVYTIQLWVNNSPIIKKIVKNQ